MLKKIFPVLKNFSFKENIFKTFQLILSLSKWWTILSVLLMLLETLTYLYSFYTFKVLINLLTENDLIEKNLIVFQLYKLVGVTIIYLVIKSTCSYVVEINAINLSKKIDKIIHEKAILLDLEFYENPSYFDTLKRAFEESVKRPIAILNNIVEIFKNTITGIGFMSIILSVNWILIPFIVLMIIPSYFVKVYTNKRMFKWHLERTKMDRKLGYLRHVITGDIFAKELRTFDFGEKLIMMFGNLQSNIITKHFQLKRTIIILETIVAIFSSLGFILCIGYLSLSILEGNNSVGDIAMLLLALLQTFTIMQTLTSNISQLFENSLYISNVFEFLELNPKIVSRELEQPFQNYHLSDLIIENVSFEYPQTNKKVLDNISLKLQFGKIVAIVGLNGSGKSTLIKLLTRLYDPSSGTIRLGKTDIRNINLQEYRKEISVVFQDFCKYNFTAGENIHLGNSVSDYDVNKVELTAQITGADLYINAFPNKYNTMMGKIFEDGHEVSIGQWQKLAVARALYKTSRFLILDEATSAIDSLAENDLITRLIKEKNKQGVVLISHRLSVIKHADYIYVLSNGRIVQEGTHTDLIAQENGSYFNQFINDI